MIEHVNGKTGVYGLIGNPVDKSMSPLVQNTLSHNMGINNVYVTFNVTDSLIDAIKGAYALNVRGLNVTAPYKKDVMPLLCEIDELAEQIGAVNTLKYTKNGYKGYNTDIHGVCATLDKMGVSFKNQSLLLIGAGGGAYSAAFGAVKNGAKDIFIANRTNKSAELLASRIKKYYNVNVHVIDLEDIVKIDSSYFVIQATSVGMGSCESPLKHITHIQKASGVYDIIYSPPKTKLLIDAEALGLPVVNGLYMLAAQAVKAFEIWNNLAVEGGRIAELAEEAAQYLTRAQPAAQ